MAKALELSDILEKVKLTSFNDNDDELSGVKTARKVNSQLLSNKGEQTRTSFNSSSAGSVSTMHSSQVDTELPHNSSIATSPSRRSPSPTKRVTSTSRRAPSPTKRVTSPSRRVPSPSRSAMSSKRRVSSPTRSVPLPPRRAPSPTKSVSSPTKSVSSPSGCDRSPTRSVPSAAGSIPSSGRSVPSAGRSVPSPNGLEIDLDSVARPAMTQGLCTKYEVASKSSSSSRHSSAHCSASRDEKVDNLFESLIQMTSVPENAQHIINSEGMDTLVATMYPESCHGCGTMPLGHIFHLSKRGQKSQSMKAISNLYRNLGESGRKHYKVHRHTTVLVRSLEGLIEGYANLKIDPDTPLPQTQPLNMLAVLTKLSFDENYRTVMNDLGVVFAVSEYIQLCALYKPVTFSLPEHAASQVSLSEVVKYGCTVLTNLSCGDQHVKSALSQLSPLLEVLLGTLYDKSESIEVVRVVVSLFRNLSWRASSLTKHNLAQVQVCSVLLAVGRSCDDVSTMRVLTSTLWNLSAHNTTNKEAMCNEGLDLIAALIKQPMQRNTAILENTLGVLRNISSHITQVSQYRVRLRESGVLERLVNFLSSSNDTIIAMSCGALWNLSARSPSDQELLRDHGAMPLLRSLSLHPDKNIAKSANGALRNLLSSSPPSRSTSPASSREYHGTDQFMPQPTDLWLDDFSLISSNDSRSRTSTCSPTAPMGRRKVEGRQSSMQHLRFSPSVEKFSSVDKFSC